MIVQPSTLDLPSFERKLSVPAATHPLFPIRRVLAFHERESVLVVQTLFLDVPYSFQYETSRWSTAFQLLIRAVNLIAGRYGACLHSKTVRLTPSPKTIR